MKILKILKTGISLVVLTVMFLIGTSSAYAQHQHPASDPVGDSAHVQQELLKHNPDMKYDDEVTKEDLPPVVSSAIEEAYAGHEITKVYQARDGSYKVKLENGDEKVTAFYSINGELLNKENEEDEMKH